MDGRLEGIQFALAPYGPDTGLVWLGASGRVHAIPEEREWIKRREDEGLNYPKAHRFEIL